MSYPLSIGVNIQKLNIAINTGDGESLDPWANNSKNNTHKEGNEALSPVTLVEKVLDNFS